MVQPKPPQYNSSNSVAQRQPIFIDVNDPRAKRGKLGIVQGRSGTQIEIINTASGMSLAALQANYGVTSGQINALQDQHAPMTGDQIAAQTNSLIGTISPPSGISNLKTAWVGSTLQITWNFDATLPQNKYVADFYINFKQGSVNVGVVQHTINLSSALQGYNLTQSANSAAFGVPQTSFDTITVYAQDVYGNNGASQSVTPGAYSDGLPTPYITLKSITSGYTVTTTYVGNAGPYAGVPVSPPELPTSPNFSYVDIEEYDDAGGLINWSGDATNVSSSLFTGLSFSQVSLSKTNPITIFTPTTSTRYVRAKFTDSLGGGTGSYSNIYQITPTPIVTVNTKTPTDVTSVSGTFSNGTTANVTGNDVLVTATIPTDGNAGNSFIVQLKPVGTTAIGNFYFYPASITTPQEFLITSADIYAQFGNYYNSYTGYVISVSSVGIRSSAGGTAIPQFSRTNTLSSVTPTAAIGNVIDGYTAQFNFGTTGGTSAQVYQFFQDPTSFIIGNDVPDYMDAVYVSGGTSGSSTITVNSLTFENGGYPGTPNPTSYFGYQITGNGISGINWITGISQSGSNYILTLHSPLTSPASGNYHMQTKVYDGLGPGNIFLNYYSNVYVTIAFYDNYGDRSQNSIIYTATPINPTTSLINNAIQIAKTTDPSRPAAIYMSSNNDIASGSRILLGTSNSEAGIFVWGPNDSSPSTQILGDTSSNLTFITTNAKIADWSITNSHIQNDLSTGTYQSGYVGLSGSNPYYSFWAGADTSDNSDGLAKFSVTPAGKVTARNITIIGNGGSSDLINAADVFKVDNLGNLTATSANITGTIHAQGGTFTGNVQLNGGSIYAGTALTGVPKTVMNSSGFAAYASTGAALTEIITTPLGALVSSPGGTTTPSFPSGYSQVNFITSAALIGGFLINGDTISNSSGTLKLNSVKDPGARFIIENASNTYKLQLSIPSSAGDNVIEAGGYNGTTYAPNFFVTAAGTLNATGAIIQSAAKTANAYVQLDGANDVINIFGTPANNPGSSIVYNAQLIGNAIQSAYNLVPTSANIGYEISLSPSGISSTNYMSFIVGNNSSNTGAFQVYGKSASLPAFSVDPSGNSTSFVESGVTSSASSATSINTSITFLNSASVILGSGMGAGSLYSAGSGSSYVYINGFARIRNATPIYSNSGQYVRNIYINPSSVTPSGGFTGDIWIAY